MRLVKKTVNFDNHNAYHFYDGDEAGHPGTIWTTFPYQGPSEATQTKFAASSMLPLPVWRATCG